MIINHIAKNVNTMTENLIKFLRNLLARTSKAEFLRNLYAQKNKAHKGLIFLWTRECFDAIHQGVVVILLARTSKAEFCHNLYVQKK